MYDKDFYDRDMKMGWIRGFSNESREESHFFSRAKIDDIKPIMNELVVIDETCLRNGMIIYDPLEIYNEKRYRDCINYRSFFVGWDYRMTVKWKVFLIHSDDYNDGQSLSRKI